MCLNSVKVSYDKPSEFIMDGWKEFGGTQSAPKSMNFGGDVALDQWVAANDASAPNGIHAVDGKNYKPGFHAYREEKDKPNRSRRVYLRKITCEGEQDGKKTVVAQEMFVPSKESNWPPLGAAPAAPPTPTPPPAPPKLIDRLRSRNAAKRVKP